LTVPRSYAQSSSPTKIYLDPTQILPYWPPFEAASSELPSPFSSREDDMPETPPLTTKQTPHVFISYSHKDEKWRAKLQTFLKPAIDTGTISLWDDRAIRVGDEWNRKIDEAIETAAVAVLLLSPDYLASEWVMKQEVPKLLKLAQERNLRVLPILVRPCAWEQVDWLRKIQIFPADAKPLVGSKAQDKLFVEAAQRIAALAIEQSLSTAPANTMPDEPPPANVSQQTDKLTVDALSSFLLSNEAQNILRRARVLATFGKVDEPKVTSSCLLFGISEGGRDQTEVFITPQFFWRELQRADSEEYQKIFYERFPSARYSSSSRLIAFDQFDRLASVISDNLLNLFRRAQEISLATRGTVVGAPDQESQTGGEQQVRVHARHLLAALLVLEETRAMKRLAKILDVPQLRGQFLKFIQEVSPQDNVVAWQEILGTPVSTIDETETATQSEPDTDFRTTLAGFAADTWDGEDLLNITRDVNALASLVAARSIDPPLSIGLFGDWGSGKTHFMRQMRARVQKLSQKARDSDKPQSELGYHKKIVQIEFNAWHYIEGNLWASLVEHIFDNLRVTGDRTEVGDARKTILKQLVITKEVQKKVEQRQQELKTKAEDAKQRAEVAKKDFVQATQNLVDLRDASKPSTIDRLTEITVSPEQAVLLKQLGIPEGVQHLPSEIRKRYEDAQGFWGLLRARFRAFRADPKWPKNLLWVLFAIVVTVAAGVILSLLFKTAWVFLAPVVGFVAATWKAAKPYVEKFQKSMDTLKKKYDQVEDERLKKIITLDREVKSLNDDIAEAKNEAKVLDQEVNKLQTQLDTTDADKLLAGFIEDRAACEDYRRHLGVLALIRRDFEKLSNLLSEQRRDEREHRDATENEKAFSRIILYIDDLDRCPPEQVVKVLQAIHLLLAFPLFVVIVGVDARWVTRSLQESYDWLGVNGDDDKNKDKEHDPQETREMVDDRVVTPHDYLEKIFQIPFWLKPMGEKDCANLLDGLTKESRVNSQTSENGDAKKGSVKQETKPDEGKDDSSVVSPAPEKPATDPTVAAVPKPEALSSSNAVIATSAQLAHPVPVAVDAEIASNQEETKTPATIPPDDEQIDLAPQSLMLTGDEIEFMKSLTSLIGRSPRAVKRFLNCYRLIKVGLRQSELEAFMGQNGQPGRYPAVMLLLGIITGAPSISLHIIEELEQGARSKKTMNLNTLMLRLEENPEVTRQPDWIQVREILEDKVGLNESSLTLATLMEETLRVSRYSFRVAKAAAGQKGVGRVKPTNAGTGRPATVNQPVAN
jgi:hypothetical protein